MRIDQYIKEHKWVSRNKAHTVIKSWVVLVNWKTVTKVSTFVKETDSIVITDNSLLRYVARSAFKLKWLLEDYSLEIDDAVCLDIWSSTWGFVQILLENWAKKVYAVDVGTDQLDEILESDKRVESFENTDIRNFKKENVKENIDIITGDVSFISLSKIIENILSFGTENTTFILLFKPQFEVGPGQTTKQWVVKNPKIVDEKLNDLKEFLNNEWIKDLKVFPSKITWEKWNQEYFIVFKNS